MSILQPREDRFYRLFEDAAANARYGAELLLTMLNEYSDVEAKAKAIKAVEHKGDELTHEIYDLLNRIFVTPLDREDIAAIASALDDVLDLVEAAADDFVLYGVTEPTPNAIELASVIVSAASQVHEAVSLLRNRRDRAAVRERLTEINRLENEGDDIYRRGIQELFSQPDPVLIIKWKQIYDHLERAIDNCEDVADVLYGVLLKYA
ncbi:MAG TPA: DUF47 domain-containing protein [Ktedonobacterales bacterium]|nr:DUF47 domain-containing protein [Ktedonobacterales bacterium]